MSFRPPEPDNPMAMPFCFKATISIAGVIADVLRFADAAHDYTLRRETGVAARSIHACRIFKDRAWKERAHATQTDYVRGPSGSRVRIRSRVRLCVLLGRGPRFQAVASGVHHARQERAVCQEDRRMVEVPGDPFHARRNTPCARIARRFIDRRAA